MKILRKKKTIYFSSKQLRYIIRKITKEELMLVLYKKYSESVRIINVAGTSGNKPDNTKSWKEYWEKETKVKLEDVLPQKNGKFLCPAHAHHKNDDGYVPAEQMCGCHVKKVNAQGAIIDNTMYITPMCSGCNKRNDVFKIGMKALVKTKE